jgi:hypothetical protein
MTQVRTWSIYRTASLCLVLLSCRNLIVLRRLNEWTQQDLLVILAWIVGPLLVALPLLLTSRRVASTTPPWQPTLRQQRVQQAIDVAICLVAVAILAQDLVTLVHYFHAVSDRTALDEISEQALTVRDVAVLRSATVGIFLILLGRSVIRRWRNTPNPNGRPMPPASNR